jgi:hypothetical protein
MGERRKGEKQKGEEGRKNEKEEKRTKVILNLFDLSLVMMCSSITSSLTLIL